MILTGYWLSGLIAVGILFIGSRFLWDPAAASRDFGIPHSPSPSPGFTGWLAVKGTRDIVSGLFVFLLMANGSPRLLGEFLLVASLIAWGDAATVLRWGGSRTAAFGIHGLTALVIIAVGASLIGANR
ncbi:DUF4267 domain-containing protein [Methylocapsa sp. S129]|uniref:DUF4267 domain-containing protein n=1 Tax=Methylocapsa sp. S129 TaxID=1641869 RepID=UPI00131AFF60|nr:DUF4267 domain-containing protein [Methylocapsa sp. S129]